METFRNQLGFLKSKPRFTKNEISVGIQIFHQKVEDRRLIMSNSQEAIDFVKRSLGKGDYGYVLRKYLYSDEWDECITKNIDDIVFKPMTDFNYSRCFSYYFMEDIHLEKPFFTLEAKEQVIERGYIEFISLKISAISPFFYVEKAMYIPNEIGKNLDIKDLDRFKNVKLEKKYEELIENLEKEELWRVVPEQLKKELKGVPLEDYEPEDVTYLSYLFE